MLTPLSETFPSYPKTDPQFGGELYQAQNWDELSPEAKELRRHIVDAVHSAERNPISSPLAAKRMLEKSHLRAKYKKWVTFPLDEKRERMLVPTASGGRMWSRFESNKVPHPDQLTRRAPLPDNGAYLVLYQGNVSILAVKDSHGGSVANDLLFLHQSVAVADVLFWDCPKGKIPTLYSLVVGAGDCAGARVEFPDQTALALAQGGYIESPDAVEAATDVV